MKPYYEQDGIQIFHGDCREILPTLGLAETCITDPPYGLEFMGKGWDRGVPGIDFWRVISGSLKPGALLLSFGGTRTFHRLTCAIEDAGFEIRDCLMWLYGSGFPKSMDISKAIDKATGVERDVVGRRTEHNICRPKGGGDERLMTSRGNRETREILETKPATAEAKKWDGWGTALKPAWEPIVLAMKAVDGTFAENAQKHGVAGINVDGGRIPSNEVLSGGGSKLWSHYRDGTHERARPQANLQKGRFPANVLLDEDAAKAVDEQAGPQKSGGTPSRRHSDKTRNTFGKFDGDENPQGIGPSSGEVSRFFYTAKASSADRNGGYDVDNTHPTVKPLDLMRYLCTLTATPAGGTVLDPFMGSGSTLVAARSVGRKAIGMEIEEKYCEIAAKRLAQGVLF